MENKPQKINTSSTSLIQLITNSNLSKEEKLSLEKQVYETQLKLIERVYDSNMAENDINMILDKFNHLEQSNKHVSIRQTVKTGSGNIVIHTSTTNYNVITYLVIILIIVFVISFLF